MEWLNYHHLLYFWTVVREGGVSKAATKLRLAQPTVSGQLRTFEDYLGQALFVREKGGMQLTDVGRLVYRYADEIFSLGRELQDSLRGRPTGRPIVFRVGVADVMPKLVTYQLLKVALAGDEQITLNIEEAPTSLLLSRLATHELDLVLADAPADPALSLKVYNHLLGESAIAVFAPGNLKKTPTGHLAKIVDGAPFIVPRVGTTIRRALEAWFDEAEIRPRVVAEIDDSALIKVFAQAGLGFFAAPECIAEEIIAQYGVAKVGVIPGAREKFYGISIERKIKHPSVGAVIEHARKGIFS